MSYLRLGLAQINPVMGDFRVNREKISTKLREAAGAGAGLVVFPELAVCGYPPEDLLLKTGFVNACQQTIRDLGPATKDLVAVVGFAHREQGRVHNSAAVLARGRLAGVYHKRELPNYGVFDEKRYFTPGHLPLLLDGRGLRAAVTICEDIWVEGGEAERFIRQQGVDLIINCSASPFYAGKFAKRRRLLTGLARRTKAAVAYVNMVGGQDELVFDGGSLVIDAQGKVLASAPHFEESLHLLDLPLPTGKRRKSGGSSRALRVAWPGQEKPGSFPNTRVPAPGRLEEIYAALVTGTRDYVRKNGFQKVVLGLSGGIDSSLTAAVAIDALGPGNVVGVTMPSEFTSTATLSDAGRLAGNLGIRLLTIPITPIFQAYKDSLAETFSEGRPGIENENIQARVRGNLLMALSNRLGWLVLTTGNKSETAVGYCTLYGDMAGGFAVIKDVPKTLVFELSGLVNRTHGKDVIPASVIERPPSAELRPDQKDEDSLPPYPVLDKVLQAYVEEDRDLEAIVRQGHARNLVQEVIRLVDQNEYKRRQAPPGVKITPKAFGRDRRLPLTNRFRPGRLPSR